MEFQWLIKQGDISSLESFVNSCKNNNFVKSRIRRNVSKVIPDFSKPEFWKWLIGCLLTTQQRSGPNSNISKFLMTQPFPLSYFNCMNFKNLEKDSFRELTNFGGIRRTTRISSELKYNFDWLEQGGWKEINEIAEQLIESRANFPKPEHVEIERKACCLVAQNLKGIGPKQSRNLRQALGLTRFEFPIDSRIIKWLNKHSFPFKLSASGLADENYYRLLMDGIQKWCFKSNVLPCVLDAAIFSSYDEEWPENCELW